MPTRKTPTAVALFACLVFTIQTSQAQTPSGGVLLSVETGNNTAACSGLNDPLGLEPYCTDNFVGFSTYPTFTNAQTQLVDAVPGHMSALPVSAWLVPGATTRIIAPYQPWFCTEGPGGPYNGMQACTEKYAGSHKIVGYDESTSVVVAAQHSQMINLGYWAVSPDWYGTSTVQSFINTVVGVEAVDLARRSGYPLKLLVMIDGNGIVSGTSVPDSGCPQNDENQTDCIISVLENFTNYIDTHWAENPYYAKDSVTGANLVSVFISECAWPSIAQDCPNNVGPTDWDTIWQTVTLYVSTYKTPMEFIKEYGNFTGNADPNPFTESYFAGAYAWPQIACDTNTPQNCYVNSSNDGWTYEALPSVVGDCVTEASGCMQYYWNQTAPPPGSNYQYLPDFYDQLYAAMQANSKETGFGELLKGFDWSNANWGGDSPGKVIAQQCGNILVYSANATNNSQLGQTGQVPYLQTPTWNDYEEGTEVETGVDSCWRVSASYNSATDVLSWQLSAVSGQSEFATLSTVHGYNIWYVANSASNPTLQLVTTKPNSATSLSNVSKLINGPFISLYVEMVGMPLIQNEMSNAANNN